MACLFWSSVCDDYNPRLVDGLLSLKQTGGSTSLATFSEFPGEERCLWLTDEEGEVLTHTVLGAQQRLAPLRWPIDREPRVVRAHILHRQECAEGAGSPQVEHRR